MEKLPWFLRVFVSITFLLLLLVSLMIVSTLGVALNFQLTGTVFNYLVENNILSYEAISRLQDFALQDNQRANWFTILTALGALLSAYGFFTVVQIHTHEGQGEGGKKLIYFGLLTIFFAGAVDSVMGYKGTAVLQPGAEVNEATLHNGETREMPFKIKVADINTGEEEVVDLKIAGNGKEEKQVLLSPWEPLTLGVHNFSYYGVQQALPLVTFHAKSLKNIPEGPALIGLQVGQKIANTREKVAFQIMRLNPPGMPLVSKGSKIEGFTNDGRSVDYAMQYADKNLHLRTFELYPHMMAVDTGEGAYTLFPFGLSPSNKVGWDVLAEYMSKENRESVEDKAAVISSLKSMERYEDNVKPLIQKQVIMAASVIDMFQLPYILQMDQVHPLQQVTLNIQYEPALYIGYAGLLTLIAGLFVVVAFARRRN